MVLRSPIKGQIIPLSQVNDPVFSTGIMGSGVAILPREDNIYAPCEGTVSVVYKTKHAIGITTAEGAEILLHIGIDTVRLDGQYFENFIKVGETLTCGQKIATFNQEKIKEAGYDTTVIVVVTNTPDFFIEEEPLKREVEIGDILLRMR